MSNEKSIRITLGEAIGCAYKFFGRYLFVGDFEEVLTAVNRRREMSDEPHVDGTNVHKYIKRLDCDKKTCHLLTLEGKQWYVMLEKPQSEG